MDLPSHTSYARTKTGSSLGPLITMAVPHSESTKINMNDRGPKTPGPKPNCTPTKSARAKIPENGTVDDSAAEDSANNPANDSISDDPVNDPAANLAKDLESGFVV
jgi:hypothetical protein